MPKHSGLSKASAERVVKDIRHATRRHLSAEDKIRIVLEGLRGEASDAKNVRLSAQDIGIDPVCSYDGYSQMAEAEGKRAGRSLKVASMSFAISRCAWKWRRQKS